MRFGWVNYFRPFLLTLIIKFGLNQDFFQWFGEILSFVSMNLAFSCRIRLVLSTLRWKKSWTLKNLMILALYSWQSVSYFGPHLNLKRYLSYQYISVKQLVVKYSEHSCLLVREIKTFIHDSLKTGFHFVSYFIHGCDWTSGAFAYNLLVKESPIFSELLWSKTRKWPPPSATGIFAVWPSPLGTVFLWIRKCCVWAVYGLGFSPSFWSESFH